ncbi:MAG: hypothetical protein NC184_04250 [Roseburia sp.]|nr:hypothetical protein [Roseburia sp.]
MDKINRALLGVEDNSVRIEAVRALLKRSTGATVLSGVTATAGGTSYTTFGTVAVSQGAAVIAVFDGGSCSLDFAGKQIATRSSPIVGVLPVGTGELKLSAARSNALALVLGACEK